MLAHLKILTSISVWQNIDIDKAIMKNIDINKEILENIDKEILENIDIDKISNKLEFGKSGGTEVQFNTGRGKSCWSRHICFFFAIFEKTKNG